MLGIKICLVVEGVGCVFTRDLVDVLFCLGLVFLLGEWMVVHEVGYCLRTGRWSVCFRRICKKFAVFG